MMGGNLCVPESMGVPGSSTMCIDYYCLQSSFLISSKNVKKSHGKDFFRFACTLI